MTSVPGVVGGGAMLVLIVVFIDIGRIVGFVGVNVVACDGDVAIELMASGL